MSHRGFIVAAALLPLLFSGVSAFSNQSPDTKESQRLKVSKPHISITDLGSLSIFYRELEKNGYYPSKERTASLWKDFEFLFFALVGRRDGNPPSYDDFRKAYSGEMNLIVPFLESILEKDRYAYKMGLLGYSAKEIADVINGRITITVLNAATMMRMLGYSEREISNYLDSA